MSRERKTLDDVSPYKIRSLQLADSALEKRKDETITSFIQGLNLFIAQATSVGLGNASRILHEAKEDLVYWAAKMNYYETTEEKFINNHMYSSALFAASDFIERYTELQDKNAKKVAKSNKLSQDNADQSASTLVKKLRNNAQSPKIKIRK
jgi:hypothetical protein